MKSEKLNSLGTCPCGGEIFETVPATPADPPGVAHALPYCDKFLTLDVLEFLQYVRRARGIFYEN